MAPTDNELYIGTLAGGVDGMVKISSLGQGVYASAIAEGAFSVDPVHRSAIVQLANGDVVEHGWLQCNWHINALRAEQYDALVSFRENMTTQVYIRTLDNTGAVYRNYLAKMIWPIKPLRGDPTVVEDGIVSDFELKFIQLVEQV